MDQIQNWSIYKITNPEGRIYVGRTLSVKRRLNSHFRPTQQLNPFLIKSIKQYGKSAHPFEVIDSFEGDERYANGKEMFWIRTYMSNINKWPEQLGMNQTDRGRSIKGYKFSEESVEKRAIKNRGLKKPAHVVEITRLRYLGKTFNQQHKESISKGLMKPILMYDMDMNFIKEFLSVDDTFSFFGKKKCGHISAVCKGKRDHIYKHIFKFKNK